MKTVGAYEAKTHFAQLLDQVETGETIHITRKGKLVAVLTPVEKTKSDWREFVDRVVENKMQYGVKGVTPEEILEWIAEGRR